MVRDSNPRDLSVVLRLATGTLSNSGNHPVRAVIGETSSPAASSHRPSVGAARPPSLQACEGIRTLNLLRTKETLIQLSHAGTKLMIGFEPMTSSVPRKCSSAEPHQQAKSPRIGTVGFEPTAPWIRTRCSSKLSYIPKNSTGRSRTCNLPVNSRLLSQLSYCGSPPTESNRPLSLTRRTLNH